MGNPLIDPGQTRRPVQSWLDRLAWFVGTGFGSGLSPVAPGTAGSLVALAIYLLLPFPGDSPLFFLMILIGFPLGIWATGRLVTEEEKDPSRAVWDEFIGLWVTCLMLPKTWPWLAAVGQVSLPQRFVGRPFQVKMRILKRSLAAFKIAAP